jgi:hypothetical protein
LSSYLTALGRLRRFHNIEWWCKMVGMNLEGNSIYLISSPFESNIAALAWRHWGKSQTSSFSKWDLRLRRQWASKVTSPSPLYMGTTGTSECWFLCTNLSHIPEDRTFESHSEQSVIHMRLDLSNFWTEVYSVSY